jgi:hypothetical protein
MQKSPFLGRNGSTELKGHLNSSSTLGGDGYLFGPVDDSDLKVMAN